MTEEKEEEYQYSRAKAPDFLTEKKFEDLDIPEAVLSGLKDAGVINCTPIQEQVLPVSLSGKDVAGQAQTGTGKTIAFLVTVFTRLLSLKTKSKLPSALIVAPTRELAIQIHEDAKIIGRHTGLTYSQVVGGIDYKKQAEKLLEGPNIVICTPGRVIDYINQGIFTTSGIQIVVVDEADRLFDLGFTKDMQYILKSLPKYDQRQSMLFSATLSHRVLALTYDYMNLPEFISVAPDATVVEGINQVLYHVGSNEKLNLLLGLLEREDWTTILIFANTKADVEVLAEKLKGNGYAAEGITGDLPQPKRLKLMERFKGGKTKILVATDVASRGIHVEDISHVINYDLPQDAESYTHRIGRTARAGKTGKAISLACETYVYSLEAIETMLGKQIPVEWPDDDWFMEDKAPPVAPSKKRNGRRSSKPKSKSNGRSKGKKPANALPRSIGWSTEPGGIFGLAPDKKKSVDDSGNKAAAKKRKKRKPRRKKKDHPSKRNEKD